MDADAILRRHYARRDSLGAPALDPVKSRGRVYARRCGAERRLPGRGRVKCEGTTRHSTRSGGYACGRCGAPWPYVERFQLRGEVQESRRVTMSDARAFWSTVSLLVDRFVDEEGWDAKLYIANAVGYPIRQIVREGPRGWPDAPVTWSTGSVWRRVCTGREEWQRRLARAGIDYDRDPERAAA